MSAAAQRCTVRCSATERRTLRVRRTDTQPKGMVSLAKRTATSPYLEYCREQRPLLTASLNDSEKERLLSQMWHRQALSAVPFSRAAAVRKLSGVTPQAPAACTSAVDVQQAALQNAPPNAPPPKRALPKRAAPPESASAPSAKRVSTLTPYNVFGKEQRPLLPAGTKNKDRERLLGVLAL